jgi:glycosyltransferase involved in cell wall biosynthesis
MNQVYARTGHEHGHTTVRISVVVPFFGVERYIDTCIQALLSQRYPPSLYEVIMVDNNSTDGSAGIVRQYPALKLLSETKQGAYAARNRGIAAARGSIIAFTDPDCAPAEDWLLEIEAAMQDPAVAIVVGTHEAARRSLLLRMIEDYEREKNQYIFNSHIEAVYYGYTNNMAVRKALFDDVGRFVELPRGSDVILVRRCVDRYSCDSVRYSRRIGVRHLEIDSVRRYFRKYFTYGRSIRTYGIIAKARPMTGRERWRVYRHTVKRHTYSYAKSTVLLGVLLMGLIYWTAGRFSARFSSKRRMMLNRFGAAFLIGLGCGWK